MGQPRQRPELRLYIEGGGDSAEGRGLLREGFSTFFREIGQACEAAGIRWLVICSKSDSETFKSFRNAVDGYAATWSGLLIDSDCSPAAGADDALKLLRTRKWDVSSLEQSQCHLMVVQMETWLIADPDSLEKHFGKDFDRKALPNQASLEHILGQTVMEALRKAVRNTKSREYRKIQDGAKLLKRVDPRRVRQRASSCDRLFKTLLEVVARLRAGIR